MELTYKIKRSPKRKNLTITVERDRSIVVHAPESASEEKIKVIVESKRQWIYEKINNEQKYSLLPHPPGKELVNGESILYLGQQYQIEIIGKGLDQITLEQKLYIPASLVGEHNQVLQNLVYGKSK